VGAFPLALKVLDWTTVVQKDEANFVHMHLDLATSFRGRTM